MKFLDFRSRDFRELLGLLSNTDRIRLFALLISQLALSFLDLAGIAIFGLLGALAVNGVSYKVPGSRLLFVLETLRIDSYNFQLQAAILGLIATCLLVLRTFLAIFFTKKTLRFLGRKSAAISGQLFSSIMHQDYSAIKSLTRNEWVVGLTKGVNSVTIRIIGGMVTILADAFLLLLIIFGLFIYNIQIAFLTLLIFSVVGVTMYLLIRNRAQHSGMIEQQIELHLIQRISESVMAYREIYLRNDQEFYADTISKLRISQVESQVVASFFPLLTRYVFEAILVIGTLIVGALQFLMFDAVHAVATITIFMVASSRIAPAVMRIQQSLIVLKASLGASQITIQLLRNFGLNYISNQTALREANTPFVAEVKLSELYFNYPDRKGIEISNLNLQIKPGELVAIVGPTGSGKSTLIDLILGVLTPLSGTVEISTQNPRDAVVNWPGMISYVPQKVAVFNASIRENVAFGSLFNNCADEKIWKALEMAELLSFVEQLPGKLDYQISDMGLNLSGGQIQRLGIARALLSDPKLLVLDEATSSLDGETESAIARSINRLSGRVTVIVVAHRLSTIRNANRVIYLDQGQILSDGPISSVRNEVPAFDAQCRQVGI